MNIWYFALSRFSKILFNKRIVLVFALRQAAIFPKHLSTELLKLEVKTKSLTQSTSVKKSKILHFLKELRLSMY